MSWTSPIARKLYLRIWLAVVGSVAVLSLLVGWAWHAAEQERERDRQPPAPREVYVRNAAGELIGRADVPPRRGPPGQGLDFSVTLNDGQQLNLHLGPRPWGAGGPGGKRREDPPLAWLRPPYGFMWTLALAGLVVMLGVFPVARRLTQRLESLQRGVQRWGEGDLSVRLPTGGQDEVADLSRHFNAAATRIEGLMDSQSALLQSQKSLLANASHELRSPLARIRMAIELMGPQTPPAARAEISRNIIELDQLIDEILLASRLDANQADMGTVEPIDLIGLLAEECARVDATMDLAPDTPEVTVPGVAKLLRRAVRNLLENACRHGNRVGGSGEVSAELSLEGGQAVLRVNDRGPGVPPAQRERIFDPFYRLPGASERDGGVGLGLSLVRSIALRHGGSVACADREGGGACFELRLPASKEGFSA
ncbi:sensor histidine kinase [Ottowia thiooxydans]|uniref:sensor histidine kinase n=1 Tax=Ottowia thiooxydans TaxID=219182 RepID=UPI0004236D57|nr:HAMP domain-containing sensor histidine kinase [Ottowia thiooxydans]